MNESTFTIFASIFLVCGTLVALRLISILPACCVNPLSLPNTKKNPKSLKLLVLLGSGGHTGEMIRMLTQFKHLPLFERRYVVSSGDSSSLESIKKFESKHGSNKKINCTMIARARNIGEGKVKATIHTIRSFLSSIVTFVKLPRDEYPDVFLCNGPGTAIPIAYTLFFMKFWGFCHTKIIYVESLARVSQLSLTGMLILPISDRILVQWKQLSLRYRRCEYYGLLV